MSAPRPVAIDLDGALADTRALWDDWVGSAAGVLGLRDEQLPTDRGAAADVLDERAGNWRALLERFCEERVAVYVRRDPAVGDALRSLASAGHPIGVFTDAPEPLARLVLAQIGADRRVSTLETGTGARERLRASSGEEPVLVSSRDELLSAAGGRS